MNSLIERDKQVIWHPCSQMKDFETFPLLEIERARGGYLILKNGKKIFDGISSWWCKSLGHQHPRLRKALIQQASKYEHVIGANTCQKKLVELSEQLTKLQPQLKKVFYASEGSSAVEIALKMSLHARHNLNQKHKTDVIALENGYHGETLLALSVSDLGLYRDVYQAWLLPKVHFLRSIPYVSSKEDVLWADCEQAWIKIQPQLDALAQTTTAIILEPIVQGAGGMKIYSQDFLKRLDNWARKNDVHLIADEIMTGFGRVGQMLACDHAKIQPDFICLGKGLTAGYLPMSAVLTSNHIYDIFYEDYAKNKSFLHSHTYGGNALAAAVAVEAVKLYQTESFLAEVNQLEKTMRDYWNEIIHACKILKNPRGIGGVVAADIEASIQERRGVHIAKAALNEGVLLRPLGNTLYWFPALNSSAKELRHLRDATLMTLLNYKK